MGQVWRERSVTTPLEPSSRNWDPVTDPSNDGARRMDFKAVSSGDKIGWWWEQSFDLPQDAPSAGHCKEAIEIQRRLATVEYPRWVPVLDVIAGKDEARESLIVVLAAQAHWAFRLVELRKPLTPQQLSQVAIGILIALEELARDHRRIHGQLDVFAIYFERGINEEPDYSRPLLSGMLPVGDSVDHDLGMNDARALGKVLYQLALGTESNPEGDHSLKAQNLRLWEREDKRTNQKWCSFIHQLCFGQFDGNDLESPLVGRLKAIQAEVPGQRDEAVPEISKPRIPWKFLWRLLAAGVGVVCLGVVIWLLVTALKPEPYTLPVWVKTDAVPLSEDLKSWMKDHQDLAIRLGLGDFQKTLATDLEKVTNSPGRTLEERLKADVQEFWGKGVSPQDNGEEWGVKADASLAYPTPAAAVHLAKAPFETNQLHPQFTNWLAVVGKTQADRVTRTNQQQELTNKVGELADKDWGINAVRRIILPMAVRFASNSLSSGSTWKMATNTALSKVSTFKPDPEWKNLSEEDKDKAMGNHAGWTDEIQWSTFNVPVSASSISKLVEMVQATGDDFPEFTTEVNNLWKERRQRKSPGKINERFNTVSKLADEIKGRKEESSSRDKKEKESIEKVLADQSDFLQQLAIRYTNVTAITTSISRAPNGTNDLGSLKSSVSNLTTIDLWAFETNTWLKPAHAVDYGIPKQSTDSATVLRDWCSHWSNQLTEIKNQLYRQSDVTNQVTRLAHSGGWKEQEQDVLKMFLTQTVTQIQSTLKNPPAGTSGEDVWRNATNGPLREVASSRKPKQWSDLEDEYRHLAVSNVTNWPSLKDWAAFDDPVTWDSLRQLQTRWSNIQGVTRTLQIPISKGDKYTAAEEKVKQSRGSWQKREKKETIQGDFNKANSACGDAEQELLKTAHGQFSRADTSSSLLKFVTLTNVGDNLEMLRVLATNAAIIRSYETNIDEYLKTDKDEAPQTPELSKFPLDKLELKNVLLNQLREKGKIHSTNVNSLEKILQHREAKQITTNDYKQAEQIFVNNQDLLKKQKYQELSNDISLLRDLNRGPYTKTNLVKITGVLADIPVFADFKKVAEERDKQNEWKRKLCSLLFLKKDLDQPKVREEIKDMATTLGLDPSDELLSGDFIEAWDKLKRAEREEVTNSLSEQLDKMVKSTVEGDKKKRLDDIQTMLKTFRKDIISQN